MKEKAKYTNIFRSLVSKEVFNHSLSTIYKKNIEK